MIEPQGGELPYEIADKRPKEFYSTVLHQDIKKYKVKMRGRQEYEWTQRPLLKIIISIKEKLAERIGAEIGQEYSADIKKAMVAEGVEQKLRNMMENEHIELIGENS